MPTAVVGFVQINPHVQKVMLLGCDWRISIRLVSMLVTLLGGVRNDQAMYVCMWHKNAFHL